MKFEKFKADAWLLIWLLLRPTLFATVHDEVEPGGERNGEEELTNLSSLASSSTVEPPPARALLSARTQTLPSRARL